MNDKNYEYLKDQLKYTGFGDGLNDELKENMLKGNFYFNIRHHTKFGNEDSIAVLYFKKVDASETVYFNRYHLSLKPEQSMEVTGQTFNINKENNITLKEAYNLLNGRAVNKDLKNSEGEKYNAWLQIDFKDMDNQYNYKYKQYHQNYGYDLGGELTKLPIRELTNSQSRADIIQSLQKGNLQSVTLKDGYSEQKIFIEANPRFKTINVYDSSLKMIAKETLVTKQSINMPAKIDVAIKQSSTGQSKPQSMRTGNKDDGSDPGPPQKTRKKGLSH